MFGKLKKTYIIFIDFFQPNYYIIVSKCSIHNGLRVILLYKIKILKTVGKTFKELEYCLDYKIIV